MVAGQGQTGKSATKRRLGGGTGLPPIDGGVSSAACMLHHHSCMIIQLDHKMLTAKVVSNHSMQHCRSPGGISRTVARCFLCHTLLSARA
jgi:hypothetical protein